MNFIILRTQGPYDKMITHFLEFVVNFYKPLLCDQKNMVFSDYSAYSVCLSDNAYCHKCVVQILHILCNFCELDISEREREKECIIKIPHFFSSL